MRAVVGVGLLVAVLAAWSCGGSDEQPLPAKTLRIATGGAGGVYAAYGGAIASVVNGHLPPLRASALHSGGSFANLRLLDDGGADLAFSQADSAAQALRGSGDFARPVPIAALARLYDDYVQVVVRSDSEIRRLKDLARRPVAIGARGSGTSLIAARVLAGSGLRGARDPRRMLLDLGHSVQALTDGRIDAFFWSGGLPTPAIDELRRDVPIRLINLPGVAVRLARRYGDLYTETTIPTTAYGLSGEVTTVSVANLLVVRRDLDDQVAYRVTRALFEHRDELRRAHREAGRLNSRSAIATYPLSLHPGAARFLGEDHPQ